MTLLQTLRKYKWYIITILIVFHWIILFYLTPSILSIIIAQVKELGFTTITTKIGETLDVTMMLSTWLCVIILLPVFAVYGYKQFSDALYDNEKIIFKYVWIALALGYVSIFFGYIVTLQMLIPFFVQFNGPTGIINMVSIEQLLMFIITNIIIVFCIVQVPLLMRGFSKIGIVSKAKYKQFRVLYFAITLMIVAWITPLDLVTTLLFQLPVYGVYEIGILLS